MITIDGYGEIARIGRGGLGDVYRATRSSTGATVAIKVLRNVSDESVAWRRTRRELTALVALAGHANVIQLLEVLDLPEGPALVMEYAPGGSVAELLLRRDGPLTVGETVLVGRQTATALVAAHAQGIVHRDVKPQNLLIDAYGQVKLCDFGIAAVARSDEFQARTSAVSMRYASPEDLDDEIDVGPASDVYSLGATMLHLARGAPPTLRERLAPWQSPATADTELAALDGVVGACLLPTPAERPSAAEVADELERLGWSIDERNPALAFDPADPARSPVDPVDPDSSDHPVDGDPAPTVAGVIAGFGTDDDPTVLRSAGSSPEPSGGQPDDTMSRTDRRTPRPPPSRRRRFAGVAAVVALVAGGVLYRATRDGSDGVAPETVARPEGLTPIAGLDWPLGDVGECLVQVEHRLTVVPCSEPHDLQRIAVGTLDPAEFGPEAGYDRAAVEQAVRTACSIEFESAVGRSVAEGGLDVPFSLPSADTWERAGDRTYQCLVGVDGRRVVGDVVADHAG